MAKGNPFMLSSGRIPLLYIDRLIQKNKIIDDFTDEIPSNQIYMLTGIRGSGKTVMMTDVEKTLEKTGEFIVINLSIDQDMILEMASELYEHPEMKPSFIKMKYDFSLLGIGVSIEKAEPVSDVAVAIRRMLEVVKKKNKKVLIAMDEVVNNAGMRKFGSLFSILLRTEYPVFLLMTGLPHNIYNVINSKTLTFLARAPRLVLEPINYTLVRNKYMEVFNLDKEKAEDMAALIKGYSFGFQLLGYLLWERRESAPKTGYEEVLPEFDARLAEGAYDKIWLDLAGNEIKVVEIMASKNSGDISVIREYSGFSAQQLNNIKKQLINKGIINSKSYGNIEFCLPRFREYILDHR